MRIERASEIIRRLNDIEGLTHSIHIVRGARFKHIEASKIYMLDSGKVEILTFEDRNKIIYTSDIKDLYEDQDIYEIAIREALKKIQSKRV